MQVSTPVACAHIRRHVWLFGRVQGGQSRLKPHACKTISCTTSLLWRRTMKAANLCSSKSTSPSISRRTRIVTRRRNGTGRTKAANQAGTTGTTLATMAPRLTVRMQVLVAEQRRKQLEPPTDSDPPPRHQLQPSMRLSRTLQRHSSQPSARQLRWSTTPAVKYL